MNARTHDNLLDNEVDPKIKEQEIHLQRLWWLERNERAKFLDKQTRGFILGMMVALLAIKAMGMHSQVVLFLMNLYKKKISSLD